MHVDMLRREMVGLGGGEAKRFSVLVGGVCWVGSGEERVDDVS
jgi:hypothetical protein